MPRSDISQLLQAQRIARSPTTCIPRAGDLSARCPSSPRSSQSQRIRARDCPCACRTRGIFDCIAVTKYQGVSALICLCSSHSLTFARHPPTLLSHPLHYPLFLVPRYSLHSPRYGFHPLPPLLRQPPNLARSARSSSLDLAVLEASSAGRMVL